MRNAKVIAMLRDELAKRDERIAELEDRLMAGSLAELRAFRPVAMPADEAPPETGYWTSDPTGLVRDFVPFADQPDAAE